MHTTAHLRVSVIQASRPGSSEPEQPRRRRRFDVGLMLRRHRLLFILGTSLGLAIGYAGYCFQTPVFQSTARVLVVPENGGDATGPLSLAGGFDGGLGTQVLLIRSPLLIGEAVESHQLAELRSLTGVRNPVKAIQSGLAVAPAPDSTSVIELTYQGTRRDDCAAILNAIVASYRAFLERTQEHAASEPDELLIQAKDKLLAELREKEAAYETFRAEVAANPMGAAGASALQARIGQIEASRAQLLIERIDLEAQIEALEAELAAGPSRESLPPVPADPEPPRIPRQPTRGTPDLLGSLLLERQLLLEDHGPDHPRVKALDRRIELAKRQAGQPETPTIDPQREPGPPATTPNPVATKLAALRRQLAANRAREKELDAWLERERGALQSVAAVQARDEALRKDIARLQQLFDRAVERLDASTSTPAATARYKTQVVAAAETGRQVAPNLGGLLAGGTLLASLISVAVAWLLEASDKRFRTPADLQRLGLYILGHVPVARGGGANPEVDPALITFHDSASRAAEAYRGVRTAVLFHTRDLPHKVIQVTSARPLDGKSTVAANLAISIAQSGRTVLLIDADLRTPHIHKLFGLDDDTGMVPLLRGDVELRETIHPTPVENLWALPCGPVPENPAELLSTAAFQELIEIARCTFDFVVIDTPPLLTAADPGVVAARADAVVFAIGVGSTLQSDATRALDSLRMVGANVIGVVVNGIDEQRAYKVGYRGPAQKRRKHTRTPAAAAAVTA
jgi:capsular exopolysaccharide synthesis family protein